MPALLRTAHPAHRVSIRSRRLGREMHLGLLGTRLKNRFNPLPAVRPGDATDQAHGQARNKCFNPLPAVRPGDASIWLNLSPLFLVSIRSRRLGREMPSRITPLHMANFVSIRSRRLGREMPYKQRVGPILNQLFQSAPGG